MHQILFFSIFFYVFRGGCLLLGLRLVECEALIILDWEILIMGGVGVSYSLVVDGVALLFASCVFFISGNVFFFSEGYIEGEANKGRFSYLVFLFILSMVLLIFSGNLVSVLLGWDGLGLTSFLLVVYYQNPYSFGAGIVTVLTNRLGDVGLILSMGLLLDYGHWGFRFLGEVPFFVLLLIFSAALTKRAQWPFSSWLPIAIAAPTPVSALVHSSTLVTAGVYLLIRFNNIIGFWGNRGLDVILFVRSLTIVMAGLAAFVEVDFKKIIAYSTLRQLGVIIFSLGLGSPILSFFHLLSHALFKALIFVCAGTFIHHHIHRQDVRLIGGLSSLFPLTQLGLVVSNLALCGFPFFSGFYSKDPIFELSVTGVSRFFAVFFMVLGLALTRAYSFRAATLSQLGEINQVCLNRFSNNIRYFTVPVFMLGVGAVCWGAALNWVLVPPLLLGTVRGFVGAVPVVLFLVLGGVFLWFNSGVGVNPVVTMARSKRLTLEEGFVSLWFLSYISSQYLIKDSVWVGGRMLSVVDQGWIEWRFGLGAKRLLRVKMSGRFSVLGQRLITIIFMGAVLAFCFTVCL